MTAFSSPHIDLPNLRSTVLTGSVQTFLLASLCRMLNYLLQQEEWARTRLQGHADKTFCLDLGLAKFHFAITPMGLLEAGNDQALTLTLKLPTQSWARLAPASWQSVRSPQEFINQAAMRAVQIEGDADLAQTLGYLAQHLRWDAEQDIARLSAAFGPFAPLAEMLVHPLRQLGQGLAQQAHDSVQRSLENVQEYLVYEQPMLVARGQLLGLTTALQQLRERLDRLQKRVEHYERQSSVASTSSPNSSRGTT